MKIIIITPFKVGSSTLSNILQKKYKYVESWENDITLEIYNNNPKLILRGHTRINYKLINNNHFDIWFTIVRKPTDIYLSGLFQDIEKSEYPYFFGDEKKVLNENNEVLLSHFLKYEWNKFKTFSFDFNFNEIFKYTTINIYKEDFDKKKGYSIYYNSQMNIKVCVMTIEALQNIDNILSDLKISNKDDKKTILKEYSENESSRKWYKEKYIALKKILPISYFEKYKDEDEKILHKFY